MSPQRRTALASVVAAAVLIALKLSSGLASGSLGLVSEALHSGTDLVAALLTLYAVGYAARPADVGHPYGHGKAEHLAALAEAVPNPLSTFVTDRYCLYAEDRRGTLRRAEFHRLPWKLREAECELELNTMAPDGVEYSRGEPRLHFVARDLPFLDRLRPLRDLGGSAPSESRYVRPAVVFRQPSRGPSDANRRDHGPVRGRRPRCGPARIPRLGIHIAEPGERRGARCYPCPLPR